MKAATYIDDARYALHLSKCTICSQVAQTEGANATTKTIEFRAAQATAIQTAAHTKYY